MEMNSAPTPSPSASREELLAALRADIDVAAALAPEAEEPLYRYLGRLADEGSLLPTFNRRPNVHRIARDTGIKRWIVESYRKELADWQARFLAALYPDPEDAFPVQAANPDASAALDPSAVAALVAELEAELAQAGERDQIAYHWLIKRAKIGAPLPMRGRSPNMKMIAREMGSSYNQALKLIQVMNRWAPRFPGTRLGPIPRRDTLPGVEGSGTDVPVDALLAGLHEARTAAVEPDEARVLEHLIAVAQAERVVPRTRAQAALTQILRDAGAQDLSRGAIARRALDEWVGFFGLEDFDTQQLSDGSTHRSPVVAKLVADHIAFLRTMNLTPLDRHAGQDCPSYRSLADQLNVSVSTLQRGEAVRLIHDYWLEAGPGKRYNGRGAVWLRARRARRKVMLDFCEKRINAGLLLPGSVKPGASMDHDELVRMLGIPGDNLAGDYTFLMKLHRMNPTFERAKDLGGIPANYAQLIDALQRDRIKNVAKGSVSSTMTKVNRAIEIFYLQNGRDALSEIGDDFEDAHVNATVAAVKASRASGDYHDNWKVEINKAKSWLAKRKNGDMLGDDFHTVLGGAIRRDGRTLSEILRGLDLEPSQVTNWMRGETLPSSHAIPMLEPLAVRLKLPSNRLSELLDPGARRSGFRTTVVEIPPGVHEFLPDDWATLKEPQLRSMVEWIDDNLVHSNSIFGHTMREVAKRRKLAQDTDAYEEEAQKVHRKEAEGEQDDEVLTPLDAAVGRHLDGQLAATATGLGKALEAELRALRVHMTVNFPQHYLRRPGAKWQVASTAPMKMGMITRFLKWQTLPEDEGGLGRNPRDLTLADLVHPPLVFAYIDYKARLLENVEFEGAKRGKIFTGTEVDLLRTFKALVSREFGLVTQKPELSARQVADPRPLQAGSFISLSGHVYDDEENKSQDKAERLEEAPERDERVAEIMPASLCGLDEEAFAKACHRAQLAYEAAERHVDEEADMVRDPAESIQPILDAPQPMTVLLRQLALASKRIPDVEQRKRSHHLQTRDLLMARLFAITAIRSRNMHEITVDGPRPKLTFDADRGKWLLQIHWREFKNYKSAVLFGRRRKRQPYKKWLPNTHGLYKLIEYYLEESRPHLLELGRRRAHRARKPFSAPPNLFVTSHGNSCDEDSTWAAMKRFTARYVAWNPFRDTGIPLVQPFGPHSFRDIRATDILLNPETANPFLEAAYALQTSPTMIQNHYGIVTVEKRTAMDDISFLKREAQAYSGIDMDD